MSSHTPTPGPWHAYVDPTSGMTYITDDAGNTIAMTSPMEDDPEAESANARLIAAAPGLLAALEACPLPSTMGSVSDHYQRFYDWYHSRVKPAISKATEPRL